MTPSPFAPHYFAVAPGLRMHYAHEGKLGDPVVFVHGNPTWSYFFRSLVAGLRDGHVCIAPDHIGCGLSDKPPDSEYDYQLKDRIDDLDRLLRHLVPAGPVNLVVHDWGGMIGLGWAVRYPERLKRLVILNTAAFLQREGKPLPWQIWVIRDTFLGPLLVQGLNLFSRGLVTFCAQRTLPRAVRDAYLAPYDSWSHRLAVLKFVQDVPQKPGDPSYALAREIEAGLEQFRDTPALICWGMRDFVFDADFLADWRKRLPGAEVHRFEDAHHLVLEDAGDRIVPLVRRFLGGPAAGT